MDKQPLLFKIAHLSDLHFSKIGFSLKSFFSKECIGNLNLLLHRKKTYRPVDVDGLIETFKQEHISHVLISGDLSTTSSCQEFTKAQEFLARLESERFKVFVIPGNHDNYTRYTEKHKLFYRYFLDPEPYQGFSLKSHKITAQYLGDQVWLVLIDTTKPAPVYKSTGTYTHEQDQHLRTLLQSFPKNDLVFIMNHFPLLDIEEPRRRLIGSMLLRQTLQDHPNVKLYLHGHTHKPSVQDYRGSHLPIISDSGSLSHIKKGGWNSLEIYPQSCQVTMFKSDAKRWVPHKQFSYTW